MTVPEWVPILTASMTSNSADRIQVRHAGSSRVVHGAGTTNSRRSNVDEAGVGANAAAK